MINVIFTRGGCDERGCERVVDGDCRSRRNVGICERTCDGASDITFIVMDGIRIAKDFFVRY